MSDVEPSSLDTAYNEWRARPTPESLGVVLHEAQPMIDRAVSGFGIRSPAMSSHAKVLLATAMPKFDPQRKVPLRNWMYTQLQPLMRQRGQEDPIPIPERVRRELYGFRQAEELLTDDLGRPPTEVELADRLRVPPARVRRIRRYAVQTVPEAAFMGEEGETESPGVAGASTEDVWMAYIYHDLPPTDRYIWEQVKAGKPKVQIARELKLSPAAVTQRAARIASRLAEVLD